MRSIHIRIVILVLCLSVASNLWAQAPASANQSAVSVAPTTPPAEVPRLVKFTGTLFDAQGQPMKSPVGVTFAIYKEQEGGAALWLETQNVELDLQGRYSVLLGATKNEGLPLELFTSPESRWLGVQVEHEAEQPRVLLVSVPYALKAADAETLGGKPLSSFVLNEPQTTSTAKNTQTAAGTSTKTSAAPQPLVTSCASITSDGTATANSISLFTAPCNIQGSVINQSIDSMGRVTVNMVGLDAGLRLSGTGTHQVTVTSTTTGVSGRLGEDSTGFFFSSDTNGKVVKFLTNNGAPNEWMRITSAGNVGIHTQTPAANLDVQGNGATPVGSVTQSGTGTGLLATAVGSGVGNDLTVGTALRGVATATTGVNRGVVGTAAGPSGRGIEGIATSTTSSSNIGVAGFSAGDNGAALLGDASSPTGLTNGLHAISESSGGLGVFAEATATTGTTFGVQGNSASTGGTGVFGLAIATSGSTVGVKGQTNSPTGFGVRGESNATSGFSFGVSGFNASNGGIAVDGFANSATGNTIGTRGFASSTSGTGVQGVTTATSGSATGVVGQTSSSGGIGVDGQNLSTTGNTATGTRGLSANPNGQGVLGEVDASGGFSIGVHGIVRSSSGTAGFFENLGSTQGGNLLKADFGATTEFNVDAFGNGFFNGKLGAGTPTPAHTLEVVAGGTTLADAWTTRSTARLKTNIHPIIGALDKVQKLRGVSYDWKANGKHDIGLIAEEVAQVLPEIVAFEPNGKDAQGLDYARLTALLIEAVKQQQTQINLQKAQIRTLQSRLRRIERRPK